LHRPPAELQAQLEFTLLRQEEENETNEDDEQDNERERELANSQTRSANR